MLVSNEMIDTKLIFVGLPTGHRRNAAMLKCVSVVSFLPRGRSNSKLDTCNQSSVKIVHPLFGRTYMTCMGMIVRIFNS